MDTTNTCRVNLIDSMGNDVRVTNAARVSFAKESLIFNDSDARLLTYLAKHDHWTPFAHVVITLRIAAPVFVARQWFRSTIGVARNETSRRYVSTQPEYYLPDTIRHAPEGSLKQGSGGPHKNSSNWLMTIDMLYATIDSTYNGMIRDGVAPEQARMILPMAHMTEWYETGSLAFFGRVAGLRSDHHAQQEIQDLMELVDAAVVNVAPVAWTALRAAR